ncbi:MAG TPA: flagellar assembly peptidoglycan hydrolase FlgJ [Burkholderiaceae bacterium]|nr:flagellar assembly peptidoglycan hydrolase FlgJ [Burkholderiaceae bacterium]
MISTTDTSNSLAVDANGLNGLRLAAKQNSPEALKAASKQFEAVFLDMMLKSMRDATPQDGPMDNDQSRMFTTMLDQQMSQKMADKGVGLADALVRQLTGHVGGTAAPAPTDKSAASASAAGTGHAAIKATGSRGAQSAHVKAFQDLLGSQAEAASQATGVPAKFMLGQAALESGWGKREIRAADGSSSHNVFGMKATSTWKGKVVETPTTEYINGVPQTRMQKFRVYDSYADAFHDYAKMLSSNPRYGAVMANSHDATSFAQGLQKAGYATDPHYAAKLANIINKSLV